MKRKRWSEQGSLAVGALVVLGLLGALVVTAGMLYGYANNLRNTGIGHETSLNAQYLDNQNELSNYVSAFYEKVGVANLKSEKMNEILRNAVSGRYDKEGAGFGKGSPFFSAIVEAYPNLAGLDVMDKIVDYVSAGREAFKAKQSKLLDQLRAYDKWRAEGLVQSWVIERWVGYPTLEARLGTKVVKGADAREQMYLIVLASDAKKAYETGTMEPLQVPGAKK